ncbi:hypothetical protein BA011_16770 [Rhizobium leguminosarum]|uniref:Uncharacterized protein n=1 Tax=Rhizobium leguminosarum TaxID=384 RepID=A0A1B1CBS1_RHILE|nr:hypothetical protein BA011_16770 [Rhizobium leguminosarum]
MISPAVPPTAARAAPHCRLTGYAAFSPNAIRTCAPGVSFWFPAFFFPSTGATASSADHDERHTARDRALCGRWAEARADHKNRVLSEHLFGLDLHLDMSRLEPADRLRVRTALKEVIAALDEAAPEPAGS